VPNIGHFRAILGPQKGVSALLNASLALSVTVGVEVLRSHRKRQKEERLRLGTLWEDNGFEFPAKTGTPMNAKNLTVRSFKPLLKRAGLPCTVRLHDVRHTCATLLLGKGVHPKIVQELLGHATIAITLDTYSHVLSNMQSEAVSAMEGVLS
jgi:integrase